MIKKINLTLPRGWDACTREQLETIADVMREQVERQDRYHPFSMQSVKVALFFVLAGIEIVEGPNPRVPVEEQYYTCRLADRVGRGFWARLCRRLRNGLLGRMWRNGVDAGETFSLYIWQINYWLTPKAKTDDKSSAEYMAQGKGLLDWLDNENGSFLTRFVYDEVKRSKRGFWHWRRRTFKGPLPDLDGFSWAQYRFAADTMQNYTKLSNSFVRMRELGRFSDEQMMKQAQTVDLARAMFLATVFNGRTKFIDTNTGIVKRDYHYESNQCTDNAQYFRGYPDTQWQVILFWWTGMMHTLSRRYPHVFKVQKVDRRKNKPSTPLEIYTATTATMQKYAGLTEDQVNNQSYSLVLEHLERLAKENEEMEKVRRKK